MKETLEGKKECKHDNIKFTEEIVAMQTIIFEEDKHFNNNEYGNSIKTYVECCDCGMRKAITNKNQHSLPNWIKSRIKILISENEWWLSGSI